MLGEDIKEELANLLEQEGISKWECVYQLGANEKVSYDHILAHPENIKTL